MFYTGMGSFVRNYVWCLNNVDLCLTSGNFCTRSPTFFLVDTQCEFYLQFGCNEGMDHASVFLCRCDDDRGIEHVIVNFWLTLQSFRDGHVDTYRSTSIFTRGQTDGFNVSKTRQQDNFSSRDTFSIKDTRDDSFIVKCEIFNPRPTFDHTSTDIDILSEDLFRLHILGDFANADLVAGDCTIPVHREILSVRSPVFERTFETLTGSRLDTPFPAPVVRAILAFVYSANIAKINFDSTSLQQVLHCARYYGISDLVDLLTPNTTCFTTNIDYKFETHLLRFDGFTKLQKSHARAEHHPLRMNFDENIEMVATLLLDPYIKRGHIDVEISLKNLWNMKSVRVRVYLLDGFNTPWRMMKGERNLEPNERGTASWRFEYQSPTPRKKLIFPEYSLRLQCEIKFKLSDEYSVSEPDFFERGGYEAQCVETSRAFVRSLERLMESISLSDTDLLLPAVDKMGYIRMPVHRSVLAARSPMFKCMLEAGRDLTLDVPEEVAKALLRYAYTGNLTASRSEAICLLHDAAATCRMDHLRIAIREVVAKMALDLKNVYSVYLIAVREKDRKMQESCKNFILENRDIIFGSIRWENFRKRHGDASDDIKKYIAEKKISMK